jgi:hypothetical protein
MSGPLDGFIAEAGPMKAATRT